ncbi:MAG: hypothetical protein ISS71_05965 [Phycisphaerae bacterium]|nr:hypothetical protein [Phycisphaerae bacterium]
MNKKIHILLIIAGVILFLCGCLESTSYERSISLLPPAMENTDPNIPPAEPVDPLDMLAAVEKIAGKAGLKPYTATSDEISLLDIADADLLDDTNSGKMNVTEWKHPELPVYLTVTRKTEEILILLNHTPDATGKPNRPAQKLFEAIQKQLLEISEH